MLSRHIFIACFFIIICPFSCSQKVTYENIYQTNGDQCQSEDIVRVLDVQGTCNYI